MNNAKDLYLYQRNGTYIPRIAAVHDLCGYGKCSLGVAIPVPNLKNHKLDHLQAVEAHG